MSGEDLPHDSGSLNGSKDRALMLVGYFIRESMAVLGINYSILSERTGIPARTLNDYGLGRIIPSSERFSRISTALDSGELYHYVDDLLKDPDLVDIN